MDEIRSNNSAKPHHLSLETLKSNPFLSQASQQNTQETSRLPEFPWMNPASSVPSFISVAKNSELLSTHHSESRCMIIGKKVLDLELPCSEYIDSDEEKSVKLMRELFAVTRKSTDLHMGGPSSSDNLIPGSNSAMKQCFDLNEPINIEEESNELVIKLEDEAGPISGFSIDLNELFKLPEPPSDNEAGEKSADHVVHQVLDSLLPDIVIIFAIFFSALYDVLVRFFRGNRSNSSIFGF